MKLEKYADAELHMACPGAQGQYSREKLIPLDSVISHNEENQS